MITRQCVTEDMLDWESPAGGAIVHPHVSRYGYVYRGADSRHWLAQPCDILSSEVAADGRVDVVFACGCRTRVSRDCVHRTNRALR